MKNITFTYDSWMDGEQGEACMTVMVNDERAEMLDAAFNAPAKFSFSKIRQSVCAMPVSASAVGCTPATASRWLKSRRSEL